MSSTLSTPEQEILQQVRDFCRLHPADSAIAVVGFQDLAKQHGQLGFRHYQQVESWIEAGLSRIADGLLVRLTPEQYLLGIAKQPQLDLLRRLDQQLDAIQFDADFLGPWCDLPVHAGVSFPSAMDQQPLAIVNAAQKALIAAQVDLSTRTVPYSDSLAPIRLPDIPIQDFAQALTEQRLQLVYQPIFTQEHTACGCEALLRWLKPDGSLLAPTEFLPLIEDTHLIRPLGCWVLETACKQLNLWRSQYPIARDWRMFINVSRRQLEPSFVDFVAATLQQYGLNPADIELEITESTIAPDRASAIQTLHSLRELGCTLAIDDFGTGHSTMLSLKHIPAGTLKIDRSFISTMRTSLFSREIVRSTINMAKELGLETVVEGIEEAYQLEQVLEFGCDNWQGYLGSHPLPPGELAMRYLSD